MYDKAGVVLRVEMVKKMGDGQFGDLRSNGPV